MSVQVGQVAAIAVDPARNDGREHQLVYVEHLDQDRGATVVTIGPASERRTGLPVYASLEELRSSAEVEEAKRHVNTADKALKDEDGNRRQADFVDVLPWVNGVFPPPQGDSAEESDDPDDPARAPAKKAAPTKKTG